MPKLSLKQWAWVIPRVLVLGPLAILVRLGEWAEEAFEFLSDRMPKENDDEI